MVWNKTYTMEKSKKLDFLSMYKLESKPRLGTGKNEKPKYK
jgi:hypothetical protein